MIENNNSSQLDVVIIGAGPAGGSAARELAKRGRKVLLIERSQEIGEPNYSTAGTPKETVEIFGLPKEVISATWDRILFATPRVQAVWEYPQTMGYVLDFAALRRFLAEDAAHHGAEILVGTTVTDFIEENGRFSGVRYHGVLGDGEARAKIIIDATGHNELANTKLKINPMTEEWLANAMEYVMTGIPEELATTIAFYVGSEYAHRGYSWIFPMNSNRNAKVGTGALEPMSADKNLEYFQEKFIKAFPFFRNMEPIEIHAGAARADGGVTHHVYKNIVLLGDAAHQINPLLAEGIRHCLTAGRLAAEVIDEWLKRPSTREDELKAVWEKTWHKNFGLNWRLSHFVLGQLVNLTDQQFDFLLTAVQQISPEDLFDLIFHYKFKVLLKYPSLASEIAKLGFLKLISGGRRL